jgi:hypothetical protein
MYTPRLTLRYMLHTLWCHNIHFITIAYAVFGIALLGYAMEETRAALDTTLRKGMYFKLINHCTGYYSTERYVH